MGLHEILSDSDLVARGGECFSQNFIDGVLNSENGKKNGNHATINGLTGEELERIFRLGLIMNPIPKDKRRCL